MSVRLRPMRENEFAAYLEHARAGYAADMVRNGGIRDVGRVASCQNRVSFSTLSSGAVPARREPVMAPTDAPMIQFGRAPCSCSCS